LLPQGRYPRWRAPPTVIRIDRRPRSAPGPRKHVQSGGPSAAAASPSDGFWMATTLIGLIVGFLIGAGSRYVEIPSPAPPRLIGAFLLVAMTTVAWLDLGDRRCTFF